MKASKRLHSVYTTIKTLSSVPELNFLCKRSTLIQSGFMWWWEFNRIYNQPVSCGQQSWIIRNNALNSGHWGENNVSRFLIKIHFYTESFMRLSSTVLTHRGRMSHQEDGRDRGTRWRKSSWRKLCPEGPARQCVQFKSYEIVRLRTGFTVLKWYQAQREIESQRETLYELSKSTLDQQLEKMWRSPLTSDHLTCCWKLFVTLLMTSQLLLVCIHGLRQVIWTHFNLCSL